MEFWIDEYDVKEPRKRKLKKTKKWLKGREKQCMMSSLFSDANSQSEDIKKDAKFLEQNRIQKTSDTKSVAIQKRMSMKRGMQLILQPTQKVKK